MSDYDIIPYDLPGNLNPMILGLLTIMNLVVENCSTLARITSGNTEGIPVCLFWSNK